MLPKSPHFVPHEAEFSSIGRVALRIASEFRAPVGFISLWQVTVLGARMVEAAIGKYRNPHCWNYYIGLPRKGPYVLEDSASGADNLPDH